MTNTVTQHSFISSENNYSYGICFLMALMQGLRKLFFNGQMESPTFYSVVVLFSMVFMRASQVLCSFVSRLCMAISLKYNYSLAFVSKGCSCVLRRLIIRLCSSKVLMHDSASFNGRVKCLISPSSIGENSLKGILVHLIFSERFLKRGLYLAVFIVFLLVNSRVATAQVNVVSESLFNRQLAHKLDSLQKVRQQKIADSLTWRFVAKERKEYHNQFVDNLLHKYVVKDYIKTFLFCFSPHSKKTNIEEGRVRKINDSWVIFVIIALAFLNTFVNLVFHKTTRLLSNGFFNDRVFFNQICYEDLIFQSAAFFLQYILSCFSMGFLTYLAVVHLSFDVIIGLQGAQLFMLLSFLILILFTLKVWILKICGFIFQNTKKILRIYISTLYLLLINLSWFSLFWVFIFILSPNNVHSYLVILGTILMLIAVVYQFSRIGIKILSESTVNTLPKVYLIVYFCALELCPWLLLIMKFWK